MHSGCSRAPDLLQRAFSRVPQDRELFRSLGAANYDRNLKSWEENSANSPKVPQVSMAQSRGWGVDSGCDEK